MITADQKAELDADQAAIDPEPKPVVERRCHLTGAGAPEQDSRECPNCHRLAPMLSFCLGAGRHHLDSSYSMCRSCVRKMYQ